MISELAVVIPARDEEQLIATCLDSVIAARRRAEVKVSIVVVADGCTDATADIARRYGGVEVIELAPSNVGTARSAGVRAAIAASRVEPTAMWIANTDADSAVPVNWLSEQLVLAETGFDVMIGTVRPRFGDLTAEQLAAWSATHVPGRPNGHVHGANLGIRASAYLAAGGFEAVAEHEDIDLVERLSGFALVATDRCEVITSGRRFGRTPGGYARYLREEMSQRAALR